MLMVRARSSLGHSILNLTSEEKRVFGQLFRQADTDNLGVVTGEAAVKFFEKTKLAPAVLGVVRIHLGLLTGWLSFEARRRG